MPKQAIQSLHLLQLLHNLEPMFAKSTLAQFQGNKAWIAMAEILRDRLWPSNCRITEGLVEGNLLRSFRAIPLLNHSQLPRTLFRWLLSISKVWDCTTSGQPAPARPHTFCEHKNSWRNCSEVKPNQCCFQSYYKECAGLPKPHSTTQEKAIFWDYGEGI